MTVPLYYGVLAMLGSAVCASIYRICIKYFSMNAILQITLYMLGLFIPALCIVLYYNAKPSDTVNEQFNSDSHSNTSEHPTPFDMSSLFTNPIRVIVGSCNCISMLLTYVSYKLLPLSIGVPIIYCYPIVYAILSYFINKTQIYTTEILGYGVVFASLCIMLYFNFDFNKSNNIFGFICLFIALFTVGLYFTFLKDAQHRVILQRSTTEIYKEDTRRTLFNISAIQILESSTIPVIVLSVLSLCIHILPSSIVETLVHQGVPAVLLKTSSEFHHWWSIPVMLLLFTGIGFLTRVFQMIGVNILPTLVNSSLLYFQVIVSAIAGYFVLGEHISLTKLGAIIGIAIGAATIIYSRETDASSVHKTPAPIKPRNTQSSFEQHSFSRIDA